MKMFASVAILTVISTCAFAQDAAPLSFSDEQVARMHKYNLHRIPDRLVITRDGMLPSPPDAISGFAKRNGVGLAEVGEAVFARVCENLAAQQYEQANMALSVLIVCDPEASRAHVKEFREWALHAGDPEVRCSCLWLVLNAERTDALPFVESAFRPDLLPAIGRVVLCNLFRRFVGANGDRTLSPEERAVWDAFLTRLVEREHEPEVFRKLDSVMCLNVEGWRFSDRRRRLRESRSREFLESAPDLARGIVRGIEIDRLALERGETNEVLSWQTEPFDWSKAKVFDRTDECLGAEFSVFADFPFEEETLSFMAEVGIGPGSSTNTVSSFVPPQSIASQQMLFGLEEGGAADNLHYSVPGSSTNAPRASVRAFVYDSEIDARKQTCLLLGGASSNPRIAQHYHPENVGDDIVLVRKYSTPGVSTNCLENWCCAIAFNMAVWVETGNCSAPEFSLSLLNAVDIPVPKTP